MNKEELHKILYDTLSIVRDNNISDDTLASQFEATDNEIMNFTAKILVVGGFSAGKSAMLNSFLGNEEILPEDISPETAIATELQYGTEEKVIRVKENGDEEICDFAAVRGTNSEGYSKYVYILNREQLRNLKDMVLVDMPGFDSGIETHNRALMQYISEAAAYVFVIDMNNGTIGSSSLDFLSEIQGYSDNVSFVLTKSDKVVPDSIESIYSEIKEILESVWFESPKIIIMSAREPGAGDKLAQLFDHFSVDSLMLQKIGSRILFILKQAVSCLEIQLEALDFNSKDINLAIMWQENKKEAVLNKIKQEESRLREEMRFNAPEKILSDVEVALRNQLPLLVSSALQGNEAFHLSLNNILRPVLLQSTERHIEASLDDYMADIVNYNSDKTIDIADMADKLRTTVDSVRMIAEAGKAFAKAQKYGKMYKIFSTGVAVTTNIVAPWLELLIIFLPEILGVINNIIGESREKKIREHIERIIIPQICNKLRPEIQNALLQLEEEQLVVIKDNFQTLLNNEVQALETLMEEKDKHKIDVQHKKESLSKGITEINALISRVEENIQEVVR